MTRWMGCCIAIALLIAGARRLLGRAAPDPGFAPAASRPGPGAERPVAPRRPPEEARSLPVGAAWAVAAYAATVAGLRAAGVADGAGEAWLVRDALLLAVAAASLLVPAPPLVAAGVTFFALGLVDMHVFGLFTLPPLPDAVFHGIGPVLASIGLLAHGRHHRPALSR